MQKRWSILLLLFIAVYYLLHIALVMPDLIHGSHYLFRPEERQTGSRPYLIDLPLSFLFAFIPYTLLYHYFPRFWLRAFTLCLIALPIIFMLTFAIEGWHAHMRLKAFFTEHLFYDVIYAALGLSFYFFRYSHFQELQQKEALIQSRQAELSFLRSQVNPHFLFNSLNNIYSLVYEHSPVALEALAALSDLLRYVLYDTSEKVALRKELNYIEKYISIQRLRFDHEVPVTMHIDGDIDDVKLPPLLLIPFIENAFKHGDLSSATDSLTISVLAIHQRLFFRCSNLKGVHERDSGGGIGLQNVQRRLELLYPDRHQLVIKEEDNHFITQLEIAYA